jgi:hypothetical protein
MPLDSFPLILAFRMVYAGAVYDSGENSLFLGYGSKRLKMKI